MAKLQLFLIVSTCFLYLVAAGLFSKAVWLFENHAVSTHSHRIEAVHDLFMKPVEQVSWR